MNGVMGQVKDYKKKKKMTPKVKDVNKFNLASGVGTVKGYPAQRAKALADVMKY